MTGGLKALENPKYDKMFLRIHLLNLSATPPLPTDRDTNDANTRLDGENPRTDRGRRRTLFIESKEKC